ncbi:hypothetical protein MGYG_08078 [Nannizzia gypsea CBS 118893]|uniref:Heterokaryon incompatibility domain-containing protein n=1 Tax=Arthroderma gypseum (strain ATCC MYA-4604 / CBS 118893) TaxID=535722 RepID=E4V4Z6_ARTGP|nr:hypothetical protein MGYG_08078 [Nannizzia gypsea CBS 118893]EFR05070.1 hypothetical protein MGYG_08078 [Nannizzia gypsea CBS 118893]
MYRWHEAGCQQPEVVFINDTPKCNSCLSQLSQEEVVVEETPSMLTVPHVESLSHLKLTWPESVKYTQSNNSNNDISTSSIPDTKTIYASRLVAKTNNLDSFPNTSGGGFRLLRLQPGQSDDPIRGDIEILSLRDLESPPYQTLSYSPFADPPSPAEDSSDKELSDKKPDEQTLKTKPACILYIPQPKNRPVYIGPYWDAIYVAENCEAGLKAIRCQGTELPVWVDSICIDQHNNDDRAEQIASIKYIYANAAKSMFFVGAPSEDSDLALDLLRSVANGLAVPYRVAATKGKSKDALRSLFKRLCFSSLWLAQQLIYAANPEILCGNRSEIWPPWSRMPNGIRRCAPLLLLNPGAWAKLVDAGLYNILRHASAHQCPDPRDKIFAILGLLEEVGFSVDYNLPVEAVYTGVTAHLLQNKTDFRLFNLLGSDERRLNLPSWVPDYSQPLQIDRSFDIQKMATMTNDIIKVGESKTVQALYPFSFNEAQDITLEHGIEIGSDGSLNIFAIKLCDLSPADSVTMNTENGRLFIVIDKGRHGYLLVSLKKKEYEIKDDSIFLLNQSLLVILRRDPTKGTYTFLSLASMALVHSNEENAEWRLPCKQREGQDWPFEVSLRISSTTSTKVQEFYSSLLELCEADPLPALSIDSTTTETMAVVDFGILSLTGFDALEAELKSNWQGYTEKLRWMFRDQVAIWKFIRYMDQDGQKDWSGTGSMAVEDIDGLKDNYATDIKAEYTWNLRQFCWSFLKPATLDIDELDSVWNPAFEALKAHTAEIQSWAEATGKLMNAIEFSRTALGSSMKFFPGINLPEKWYSNWNIFSKAREDGVFRDGEAFDSDYYWNWSEFEQCIQQRETLLARTLPEELRPHENCDMKAHMAFRVWGLDLNHVRRIRIV